MKALVPSLFFLAFCSCCSPAAEIPVAVGDSSDTVFHKTGVKTEAKAIGALLPKYRASVTYGKDRKVELILLSTIFQDPGSPSTLHGVALGDSRKDVLKKLGSPNKEMPKNGGETGPFYIDFWLFPKNLILEVGFWDDDHDHFLKDTVSYVIWRNASQ